ncbi:MAG: hypothetical protein LBP56_00260 [Odoribacteraceae bacterium]|jgi:hypothetical protein|nr:hypothetical protein [Odoribacteraceae bacterium]
MKEKVKKKVQAVLTSLGLIAKAKSNAMTPEDWSRFNESYKTTYGISFEDDNAREESTPPAISAGLAAEIIRIANEISSKSNTDEEKEEEETAESEEEEKEEEEEETAEEKEEEEEKKKEEVKKSKKASGKKKAASKQGENDLQQAFNVIVNAMKTISAQPESSLPVKSVRAENPDVLQRVIGACPHSKTHLFGIEHPVFARSHWFNQSIVTRTPHSTVATSEDAEKFSKTFRDYTLSLKARADHLTENNQLRLLDFKQMATGAMNIDYGNLVIRFGEEYLVRRQDMIIAYLRELPSVNDIFPWRSGVQDGEYVPTAFFGEFSQRYQPGEVFKGSVKLPPQIARVSDVMIKYKFEDLIALEKQYIGYMNKEGSDVMKWTFIEWLLVHIYTSMLNEQNRRRVIGVLVPVQQGVDNPAAFAADGALRAIERDERALRVLPFEDLNTYTKANIVDYIETLFEYVNKILPSLEGFKLYLNAKHIPWYRQGFRLKYGTDTDFAGPKLQAIDYSLENFIGVPNMDYTDYKMWLTIPGNIESLQDRPNEMYNIYFERRLEALLAMSRWKEGACVNMSGMPCATKSELQATKRRFQYIFTNFPVTALAAGATTIDATQNTQFITVANGAATALTDINNASEDRTIKIVCGNMTNATTIAKSGKFANIASAWTPVAVGDWIELYPELELVNKVINGKTYQVTQMTGNWLELDRHVSVVQA